MRDSLFSMAAVINIMGLRHWKKQNGSVTGGVRRMRDD
jgi:hypothetical protein